MAERLRAAGVRSADFCETAWYDGELTLSSLMDCLSDAFARCEEDGGNDATLELMCHPGFVDEQLPENSKYVAQREAELRVLCHPSLAVRLREAGIELIAMRDV
jgi:predicted glycoside hydrolase/deacetylase ChbG (UPF0249 family)